MKTVTTEALMTALLDRALEDDQTGLRSWAVLEVNHRGETWVAPAVHGLYGPDYLLTRQTVSRGVWRATGGQQMGLPNGFTSEMADQVKRALSDLDSALVDPATASALIQVGLYGEVRYR